MTSDAATSKMTGAYEWDIQGRHMVSAGAGTGKTYNIQILFLRKILSGVPVCQNLVMTFTELATKELSDRLRRILQTCHQACELAQKLENPTASEVIKAIKDTSELSQVVPFFRDDNGDDADGFIHLKRLGATDKALMLVNDALRDFDQIQISTIHGFCQRMLQVNAFESGLRYGMTVLQKPEPMYKRHFYDFWREFCYGSQREQDGTTSAQRKDANLYFELLRGLSLATPDKLLKRVKKSLNAAGATLVWSPELAELIKDCGTEAELRKAVCGGLEEIVSGFEACLQSLQENLAQLRDQEIIYQVLEKKKLVDRKLTVEDLGKTLKTPWNQLLICSEAQTGSMTLAQMLELLKEAKEAKDATEDTFFSHANGTLYKKLGEEKLLEMCGWLRDYQAFAQTFIRQRTLCTEYVQFLAYDYVRHHVATEKEREGLITFDDMIISLRDSLRDGGTKDALSTVIREQFKSVMVDEAQDNDPVQAEIFATLFGDEAFLNAGGMFYMIGDPKQAIYAFRGGDVDTFLQAWNSTKSQYSLNTNFRSSKTYIQALNDYLRPGVRSDDTFSFLRDDINENMEEIGAPDETDYLLDGEGNKIDSQRLLTWGYAEEKTEAEDGVAKEIEQLVGSDWSIGQPGKADKGSRHIQYEDIAVLVKSNVLIPKVMTALQRRNIPVAKFKESDVYDSPMLVPIMDLMEACRDYGDPKAVCRLLGSPLFDFSAVQVDRVVARGLTTFQQRLQSLYRTWENQSFGQMFRELMEASVAHLILGVSDRERSDGDPEAKTFEDRVKEATKDLDPCFDEFPWTASLQCRLASSYYGSYGLSELTQLRDVLQAESMKQNLGPDGLYYLVSDKLQDNRKHRKSEGKSFGGSSDDDEESEVDEDEVIDSTQRLVSDAKAVHVMTIHKSKGLQFPVVYMLGGAVERGLDKRPQDVKAPYSYHRGTGAKERCIAFSADKDVEEQAEAELNQEARRLLYVAVTRAKFMCRWIFTVPKKEPKDMKVAGMAYQDAEASYGKKREAGGGEKPKPPHLEAWTIERERMSPGWVQTSFSSLSYGQLQDEAENEDSTETEDDGTVKAPDNPQISDAELQHAAKLDNGEDEEDRNGTLVLPGARIDYDLREPIFQFPGGKRTGTCWHKIFETMDFSILDDGTPQAEREAFWEEIKRQLDGFGQLGRLEEVGSEGERRKELFQAFQNMVTQVTTRKIDVFGNIIQLCKLKPEQCLKEFDFTYRLRDKIEGREFARILTDHGIVTPENWGHGTGYGCVLTGSIDLLFQYPKDQGKFYILDWKTNSIDANPENFVREGMEIEMRKHFYALQYTLYTLAFIQYYRQLNPGWTLEKDSYEQLLGGCIYAFVRGVDQTNRGMYVKRPDFELIQALDEKLGVGSIEAGTGTKEED